MLPNPVGGTHETVNGDTFSSILTNIPTEGLKVSLLQWLQSLFGDRPCHVLPWFGSVSTAFELESMPWWLHASWGGWWTEIRSPRALGAPKRDLWSIQPETANQRWVCSNSSDYHEHWLTRFDQYYWVLLCTIPFIMPMMLLINIDHLEASWYNHH